MCGVRSCVVKHGDGQWPMSGRDCVQTYLTRSLSSVSIGARPGGHSNSKMTSRPFVQVDVFADSPTAGYTGNPVAVVQDGSALTTEQMQQFANWTNLSETTFLVPPTKRDADYQVRIFTPVDELPFAGHPTLGSAHAWLVLQDKEQATVTQQCGLGLVRIKKIEGRLSLAAPPLKVDEDVDAATAQMGLKACGAKPDTVLGSRRMSNGPTFHIFLLASAQDVLDLKPNMSALRAVNAGSGWGFIAPYATSKLGEPDFECRMFYPETGVDEDPITGSFKYVNLLLSTPEHVTDTTQCRGRPVAHPNRKSA